MIHHPEIISVTSGILGSSFGTIVLQALPTGEDLTTKVVLVGLAGVLSTFLTTQALGYLTKIQQMPDRKVFDEHVTLLTTVNSNLEKFLSAHEEWKKNVERRLEEGGL